MQVPEVNGTLFEIEYGNYGQVKAVKVLPLLPERKPDFRDETNVMRTHDNQPTDYIDFWFEEGRALTVTSYYDSDSDINSLKITKEPGVATICPISGHIMYVAEGDTTWTFGSKIVQTAYMNWLCDSVFVGEAEEDIDEAV